MSKMKLFFLIKSKRWVKCRTEILTGPTVLLWEQVVGEWRGVGETLNGGVEEAGVSKVVKTSSHPVHTLPLQIELVARKEHFLWGWDPVALAADHIFRCWWRTTAQDTKAELQEQLP